MAYTEGLIIKPVWGSATTPARGWTAIKLHPVATRPAFLGDDALLHASEHVFQDQAWLISCVLRYLMHNAAAPYVTGEITWVPAGRPSCKVKYPMLAWDKNITPLRVVAVGLLRVDIPAWGATAGQWAVVRELSDGSIQMLSQSIPTVRWTSGHVTQSFVDAVQNLSTLACRNRSFANELVQGNTAHAAIPFRWSHFG